MRTPHHLTVPFWRRCLAGLVATIATLASHGSVVEPPAFADLAKNSDYIVRARVKVVRIDVARNPLSIHSLVELDVLEVIAGEPPQPLVLRVLGGNAGDVHMEISGAPMFEPGQDEIFFIRDNGRSIYPLYAMMYGRYAVQRDSGGREYVTRSDRAPLTNPAEIATPLGRLPSDGSKAVAQALTPADFAARIRAARASTP